jgi:phytanoyl-CoA hydroxylase
VLTIQRFSLDDAEQAKKFFDENGFVILRNAFNQTCLQDFNLEVREIIRAHLAKASIDDNYFEDEIFDLAMSDLENKDHEFIASIYDTIFQCPSFFRIISEKSVSDSIRNLMNKRNAPLYGFTNRCRIDPPQDERRTYGWHQEVFYTVPKGNYLQTWAPLIRNTTIQNGTIQVAIGSHKEGIAKQSWNEIDGRATQILIDAEVINKYEQSSVEMELGELLIFSGYLAHQSGINTSNQYRYSLVGMYHDVSKLEFQTPRLEFDFRGITPKEFFDSEINQLILR